MLSNLNVGAPTSTATGMWVSSMLLTFNATTMVNNVRSDYEEMSDAGSSSILAWSEGGTWIEQRMPYRPEFRSDGSGGHLAGCVRLPPSGKHLGDIRSRGYVSNADLAMMNYVKSTIQMPVEPVISA